MVGVTAHLAVSFILTYPEFPDRCCRHQFSFIVNVGNVLINSLDILLEQLRNIAPFDEFTQIHLFAKQNLSAEYPSYNQ